MTGRAPRVTTVIAIAAALAVLVVSGVVAAQAGRVRDPAPLEAIVRADAIVFSPDSIPESLVSELGAADVLLFGETHYVQEHEEFVAALLPRLHEQGFRLLLLEGVHAYGWMTDDYVRGRRDALPDEARMLDEHLLRALRAFNDGLPEGERLRVACIDMNHWPNSFSASATVLSAGIEPPETLRKALGQVRHSEGYAPALEALARELEEREAEYEPAWGETLYSRLRELVEIELETVSIRGGQDFATERERLIIELCERRIAESPGKTVVNCGSYHMQKERFMGTRQVWLGEHLVRHSPVTRGRRVRSIAFVPIQGLRRDKFSVPDDYPFDLRKEAPPHDLVRILGEHAGDRMAYLPLDAPLFAEKRVSATYTPRTTVVVTPKRQFDAIITYPKASTLESLRRLGPQGKE